MTECLSERLRQLQPASTFVSEVMKPCGNPLLFISQRVPVVRS